MLKNSTPREIALLASLLISCGSLALMSLFYVFFRPEFNYGYIILATLLNFLLCFVVILTYLRKYIYRKIKLIYKTIHRHKVSTDVKSSGVDIDQPIIEDVEKEVEDWAKEQQNEIERYKSFAEYRRRYVGDISHELKTPIFNIQGYLHTLLDGGLEDQEIARPFLKKAAKNTERLQTIVDDLSAISRLETGDMILDEEYFDIKELANEVIDDMEMKARQHQVELLFKEGASTGFNVYADRETIRQVLTNLINNSINYGKSGGITKLGFYDMDTYILVEVADNGIGISEKHLPHLFDRFYRVDKSRSRERGGSGLGLAIVKHIMEAHQQSINVRSTAGLGSTFGFTLKKA
ncbi:two-component sensor histidine kinase [Lewinellaceae bacterium SD302]|nr:two-component sensor histidine kinase [Lewinellaceae bacterium SD302]